MTTYFIGDLQGCHDQTLDLLARIDRHHANQDDGPVEILFAGDLINRGPASLATLRHVYALAGARPGQVDSVLGNHDLHLLAVVCGIRAQHKSDTLDEIMAAPDRDALIDWLRRRPLAIRRGDHLLVHAGLLPQWSIDQAMALAGEVESRLRAADWRAFLAEMFGNQPDTWHHGLTGSDRLRCVINAMTRLRFCDAAGVMDFTMKESGSVDPATGLMPWFEVPGRLSAAATVVFGHWSALGLQIRPNLIGLDSGCVWGGYLSAVCLEDRALLQVRCAEFRAIAGKQ